jgi:hypothetical protein
MARNNTKTVIIAALFLIAAAVSTLAAEQHPAGAAVHEMTDARAVEAEKEQMTPAAVSVCV